jgi:hypothetical protein
VTANNYAVVPRLPSRVSLIDRIDDLRVLRAGLRVRRATRPAATMS